MSECNDKECREYFNRVCEVCFTSSFDPVPDESACELIHPHQGPHARCGYCFMQNHVQSVNKKLCALEKAIEKALELCREVK